MSDPIRFYRVGDDYGEFSNFAPFPIEVDGKVWPTSEHYFQAQKFAGTEHEEELRTTPSPMEVATKGRDRARPLRPDWDEVRDEVMFRALEAKFTQHEELLELLLETGDRELVEHTCNDSYWADGGDGSGENRLGILLMQLREQLWQEIEAGEVMEVVRLGHPVLRQVAEAYDPEEILSPEVQEFVEDMVATMDDYDGAGLAAPQVGVSKRLLIYGVEANPRYPEAPEVPRTVLFNPTWEPLGEETDVDWEGCLSVPGMRGQVRRYQRIRVKALDQAAQPVEFEAEGFHARVFQHEVDHLEGIVYLDRMEDMSTLSYLEEWVRYSGEPEEELPEEE